MNLTPGTRLGPYEIVSPLGAGGMGEVYRAKDTRLGREVAVKVLPQHLSSNTEVRARFEREAKTVSSLNHPHICTLFDVGREGDTDFLVMELIEGETLAARLGKGPLPVNDTLRIGSQVADALDRAHRAGVVHRDLKPGNIMLTKSGAKLMDFGLARATGLAGAPASGVSVAALTQSPTMAQPLTAEGTIVGTFQYMSPEQLEGKETDARGDLWAFGCVLYEMATGKRAFDGKSQASLIGAIMHAEPAPVSQVAPMAPPELDRLVRACLVKDPADRLQSAHDVKLQLAWLAEGASSPSTVAAVPHIPATRRKSWLAPALVGVAAVAVTALVMTVLQRGADRAPSTAAPERYILGGADLAASSTPAVSPDGSYVVYSAQEASMRRLYRRDLSSFEVTPIAGTEEGDAPFFSPDGAWIGFSTPTAVKKVPAGGGVAQVIVSGEVNAADWGEDGMIYYCPGQGGEGITALARVPATGGRPEVVAVLDTTVAESDAWLPDILPDGQTVLFTVSGGRSSWHIVASRPDGSRVELIDNAILGRYSGGYLVYVDLTSQAVLAAPFDTEELTLTGTAVPLTEPVDANFCFDIGGDGLLVYVPIAGAGAGSELVWIDRNGAATPVMDTRGTWTQPRVSPDGKRILLRKTGTNCELWLFDIERESLARIVQGTDNHSPIWSPDGRRIAYEQASAGGRMVTLTVEGAREITPIPTGSDRGSPQGWSRGGNLLVYSVSGRGTGSDIWTIAMDGGVAASPFLATAFDEQDPAVSPDGRYIAYATSESGTREVFVRPYPNDGDAWQVSIGGGGSPLWSRDGRELYFTAGTKMLAVSIETRPTFRVGRPVVLFDGGFNTSRSRDFDITPGGRFVAVRVPGGQAGQREMRVLLNWPAEMRRVSGPAH
jgi:Tol biopolymer transport system component/tRNA A-37 threonylcarbamoyl transferase component Bud32